MRAWWSPSRSAGPTSANANGKAGSMSDYQIVGPFQSHRVIVDGRRVPFLEALPVNGGKISLLLDGRYGLDISVADADAFIPWIADAIAIAHGLHLPPTGREGAGSRQPLPARSRYRLDRDRSGRVRGTRVGCPGCRPRARRRTTAGCRCRSSGTWPPALPGPSTGSPCGTCAPASMRSVDLLHRVLAARRRRRSTMCWWPVPVGALLRTQVMRYSLTGKPLRVL